MIVNTTPLHKRRPTETFYISGPMRGVPKFNFPMFDSCASWLRSQGFGAINPADHDREIDQFCEDKPGFAMGDPTLNTDPAMAFQTLLGWDLQQISAHSCTGVVMLPGWEKSTGAAHERYVAEACGKQVWLAHVQKVVVNPGPDETWADEWYMTLCDDRLLSSFTAESLRSALSLDKSTFAKDIDHVRQGSPFTQTVDHAVSLDGRFDSWSGRPPGQNIGINPFLNDRAGGVGGLTSSPAVQIGQFQTKDSGARMEFESGMVRDTQEGKPRYDLIPLLPLKRMAELYARGAQKYGDRNWEKAASADELARFKASGMRHFMQAMNGERDEDHWAGAVFNIFAAMWLEERLSTVPSVMEND